MAKKKTCSFCGNEYNSDQKDIILFKSSADGSDIRICSDCVKRCSELYNSKMAKSKQKAIAGQSLELTPKQIFEKLNAGELKTTPQWEILGEQVKMYENLARSKRANAYPTLAATANYSYMTLSEDADALFDARGSQSAYWGLAVQVPL